MVSGANSNLSKENLHKKLMSRLLLYCYAGKMSYLLFYVEGTWHTF